MVLHLGKKIKDISEKKNIQVSELANKSNKSLAAIYDIFKKEDVSTEILKQFAEIFEIEVKDFFDEIDSSSSLSKEPDNVLKEPDNVYPRKTELVDYLMKQNQFLLEINKNLSEKLKV